MQKLQGCTSVKVSLSVLLRLKLGDELLWMATMAGIKVTKQIMAKYAVNFKIQREVAAL